MAGLLCFPPWGLLESYGDTIPGRQCLASSCFLRREFKEVLVYLNSIKSYFCSDDTFNYAQAKAAAGQYREAEEAFLRIQNDEMKRDYARCYIMNRRARLAWELYLKMEISPESFSLLRVIANDCYKMGQFYYAAMAFDVLERLDPDPEYRDGKRACVGVFQLVLAGQEPREIMKKVLPLLGHPLDQDVARTVQKWM